MRNRTKTGRCAGEGCWFGWRQFEGNGPNGPRGEDGRWIFEVSFITPKDESLVSASSSAEGSN